MNTNERVWGRRENRSIRQKKHAFAAEEWFWGTIYSVYEALHCKKKTWERPALFCLGFPVEWVNNVG